MPRLKGSKNKPKIVELEKQNEPETTKAEKRALYECSNTRVKGKEIRCAKGYHLSQKLSGTIDIVCLARGDPLSITICQSCPDFDEMDGGVVQANERGWLGKVV